ncbi:MAG TPA: hypothetical protein VIL43_01440 [Burkholderiales bacterium]
MRLNPIRAALAAVLAAVCAAASAAEQVSLAETLLFESDHLASIREPLSLHYAFETRGSLQPEYRDDVEVKIDVAADGGKRVTTRYFTGARQRDFPTIEHARGNPVLLYFLDRDIRQMQRLTGGNSLYFQKHIRFALADKAEVRPVRFRYNGAETAGREIRITPYADDPNNVRYRELAGKRYVFILSDAIPGSIYQVRTVVPDGEAGVLIEESLTFQRASAR